MRLAHSHVHTSKSEPALSCSHHSNITTPAVISGHYWAAVRMGDRLALRLTLLVNSLCSQPTLRWLYFSMSAAWIMSSKWVGWMARICPERPNFGKICDVWSADKESKCSPKFAVPDQNMRIKICGDKNKNPGLGQLVRCIQRDQTALARAAARRAVHWPPGTRDKPGRAGNSATARLTVHRYTLSCKRCGALVDMRSAKVEATLREHGPRRALRAAGLRPGATSFAPGDGCASACSSSSQQATSLHRAAAEDGAAAAQPPARTARVAS